ncbi:CobW family GTP-binding protein [Sphingomonas bacterium]|uniref:CobW family GTP-binding protein n=1 Tax=Sphingomonas bacterium TaxID=1895847 RepID=UPI0020C61810|nr:GTP-binding protein [Sphingomonas bacterium]
MRDPAMRRALVIINEFGSIGIDHDLVVPAQEETVIEMASGCLCCTIRGDLVRALRDAPWRFARNGERWFDRVLIETTGLADPIPILHTLLTNKRIAELYRLDSVVTTVDAATGMATLNAQLEAVRQIAVADRLVLTKTDLVPAEDAQRLQARLRTINPAAPIAVAIQGQLDPAGLFGAALYDADAKGDDVRSWLNAEAYEAQKGHDDDHRHHHAHNGDDHDHDVNRHDDHIRSICLTFDEPLDGDAFEGWLEVLTMFVGPQILRIKGILNLAEFDRPVVVHGVQHIFHPPLMLDGWPSDDRRSRMVFITRDLDEAALRQTLGLLMNDISRFEVYGPRDTGLTGAVPQLLLRHSGNLDLASAIPRM